jgi:hypothetical protein
MVTCKMILLALITIPAAAQDAHNTNSFCTREQQGGRPESSSWRVRELAVSFDNFLPSGAVPHVPETDRRIYP